MLYCQCWEASLISPFQLCCPPLRKWHMVAHMPANVRAFTQAHFMGRGFRLMLHSSMASLSTSSHYLAWRKSVNRLPIKHTRAAEVKCIMEHCFHPSQRTKTPKPLVRQTATECVGSFVSILSDMLYNEIQSHNMVYNFNVLSAVYCTLSLLALIKRDRRLGRLWFEEINKTKKKCSIVKIAYENFCMKDVFFKVSELD